MKQLHHSIVLHCPFDDVMMIAIISTLQDTHLIQDGALSPGSPLGFFLLTYGLSKVTIAGAVKDPMNRATPAESISVGQKFTGFIDSYTIIMLTIPDSGDLKNGPLYPRTPRLWWDGPVLEDYLFKRHHQRILWDLYTNNVNDRFVSRIFLNNGIVNITKMIESDSFIFIIPLFSDFYLARLVTLRGHLKSTFFHILQPAIP